MRPHKTMTPEEYTALTIKGWHMVCKDVDGFGGVGIRYIPPQYRCPTCNTGNPTAYITCNHPACPDGRDQR